MCEQPPVIRWGRTQRAHVRTTAGYSHMKGRAQADNRQLVAQGRVRPGGPCANNRRLFEHGRVEHVRTAAGYSHIRTREALCKQPPVPRKCKGPKRPCANSRVLFAHGRVRGGRLYAHARVGSRGPCANSNRLFAHTLSCATWAPNGKGPCANNFVGNEGAMCEQPPVIRTWNGVSCIVPLVLRTARGQVRTTAGYSNMSGRAQGAMCEQQAVIRICKDNHVLFIGERSNPSEQPQVIRA